MVLRTGFTGLMSTNVDQRSSSRSREQIHIEEVQSLKHKLCTHMKAIY